MCESYLAFGFVTWQFLTPRGVVTVCKEGLLCLSQLNGLSAITRGRDPLLYFLHTSFQKLVSLRVLRVSVSLCRSLSGCCRSLSGCAGLSQGVAGLSRDVQVSLRVLQVSLGMCRSLSGMLQVSLGMCRSLSGCYRC